jgi:hypothetical protein
MIRENDRILTIFALSAATVTGHSLIPVAILFQEFDTERRSLRDSHQKGAHQSNMVTGCITQSPGSTQVGNGLWHIIHAIEI